MNLYISSDHVFEKMFNEITVTKIHSITSLVHNHEMFDFIYVYVY